MNDLWDFVQKVDYPFRLLILLVLILQALMIKRQKARLELLETELLAHINSVRGDVKGILSGIKLFLEEQRIATRKQTESIAVRLERIEVNHAIFIEKQIELLKNPKDPK